jgi:TatD DNase family protein
MQPQPLLPLIDIGANLTHESFDHDLEEVLARSAEAQIRKIMLTGTDLASTRQAIEWAAQRPNLFHATAGFHPHVASAWSLEAAREIAELVKKDEVVAVGECGLDYNRDFSPRETQRDVFNAHLSLAASCRKPVFLHQREAHDDFLSIVKARRDELVGGVVHCFTDTRSAMEDYLELGFYIGITGWVCDDRRGKELQETVRHLPLERLLIETDAPYLLPRTLRPRPKSRRNEPCYLPEVVAMLAQCKQCAPEEIARYSTRNALQLFNLGTLAEDPAEASEAG